MNLNKVDLNLFIVFDAIYTEANLTRAGQIVGITQPAVSNALARLRETFNDPLFVRTAQGMVPTPMAQNIIGPVRNALQLLRVSVQESRTFSPAQANKTFRISMTDLTEAVMLPPLFQRLRRLAHPLLRCLRHHLHHLRHQQRVARSQCSHATTRPIKRRSATRSAVARRTPARTLGCSSSRLIRGRAWRRTL